MPFNTKTIAALKPLSKFTACMSVAAALCLGAYTLTVDSLVQKAEMPSTYKWFLLKNVPGPRLIFESGSNSHHALDTDAIGTALGMTAINIADNGGYALEDKITRLETYTRKGDVIILPLEWTFYHREKLTDNYVDTLFKDNRDYYQSMPPLKRMQRALSLPPEKVIMEFSKVKSRPIKDSESPAKNLFVAALTQPTGHQSRAQSIGAGLGVAEQSCDDYILGKASQRAQLKLGANIKPVLKRLQKLNQRGIDIHFAWPAIAGDGCMSAPAYVTGFRAEIERAVNAAGFAFLGTPAQSLYGQNVRDDSPYHLTTAGTEAHTQKMIGFLKAQGYGHSGAPLDIKTFARHRLLEMELGQVASMEQPAFPQGQKIAMDNPQTRPYVNFAAGWWDFEAYGRWMRGNRAMFRLSLPADIPNNSVLKIQGITKSGRPERINVSINGALITSGLFGESAPLLVPLATLPQERALSIFLTLPDAGTPQSPLDLGESEDARSMTLHVQSMEITVPDTGLISAPIPPKTNLEVANITAKPVSAVLDIVQDNCLLENTIYAPSIKFNQGWWAAEETGRWMKGRRANFELTLAKTDEKNSGRYNLKLSGDFFMNRPQSISAVIDGTQSVMLRNAKDGSYMTSFETAITAETIKVELKLSGKSLHSPKALGLSQDDRTLTYFLKSAELIPS